VSDEVSAFFFLLTSIARRTLRELYQSIPLRERIPIRPFLTLADSNEALPDSSGHQPVPGQVSAFFCLLPSIAMRMLQDLYHSIPLAERTLIGPFPTLADICPLRYLPLSYC